MERCERKTENCICKGMKGEKRPTPCRYNPRLFLFRFLISTPLFVFLKPHLCFNPSGAYVRASPLFHFNTLLKRKLVVLYPKLTADIKKLWSSSGYSRTMCLSNRINLSSTTLSLSLSLETQNFNSSINRSNESIQLERNL